MTTASSAWTSPPSPPSGAGRCCPSHPNEYKLLRVLTSSPGTVVTRRLLLEKLWDKDGNFIDDHTLTVTVNRLRSKIEMEPILTSKPFEVWATSGRGRQHEGPDHGPGAAGPLWWPWGASSACGPWCGRPCPLPLLRGGLLAFGLGVVALVVWREVLWRRQTGTWPTTSAIPWTPSWRGKAFPPYRPMRTPSPPRSRESFSNTMRRWPMASARAQRTSRPSRNW